ncbi:Hypothetical predicted protein [Paramuricea clavata]|uniref:Uncharacterized protein n=1 Tax=Paramuricea clavata TaxID=317549 RepID=A0A6S7G984_PARCT|nr:Hypothetical predicted protein [Paramuricea clavata]
MSSPILFMFIFCLFIAVVCFGGVTFSLFTSNNFPACCLDASVCCLRDLNMNFRWLNLI